MSENQEQVITVIGGAGYIGSVLTKQLLDNNYRVRVFDNFQYGHQGLSNIRSKNLEILEGDICNITAISSAIAGSETVILLAAIVGRRVEEVAPPIMRDVNLLASSVVLDAAIEHGVSRFLFASTDSVYGVQSGIMYETGTPDPVSLYSRLKLRMEEQTIRSKRRSFHPTALRIATCYGYSPRMRFDLLANGLIRDAVCKQRISIGAAEQCRSLVDVQDVARAFLSCLRSHVSLVSGQVFNVGSSEQTYQLGQLVTLVKKLVPQVEVDFRGESPDLVDYHISSSKLEKMCDFVPTASVESSMAELRDILKSGAIADPYAPQFSNTRP